MLHICALTSGKDTPSSRYRVRQHIPFLADRGITVQEYLPLIDKYAPVPGNKQSFLLKSAWKSFKSITCLPGVVASWKSDITWLERGLTPGLLTFELFIKKPFVFDVDDAVWLTEPFGKKAVADIAARAEVVIAGNTFLANWLEPFSKKIEIVPTGVDTDIIKMNQKLKTEQFVVGWIGTSGNFRYLYAIEKALSVFLNQYNAQLFIVSDQRPVFTTLAQNKIKFSNWSVQAEIDFFQKIDVGIMPLATDEWCRGKCSFKMLQYMAAGLPVIVTPFGMNNTLLSMGNIGFAARNCDDWYDALCFLFKNRRKGKQFGVDGRKLVERHFSRKIITNRLSSIFLSL